jgi:hypothetical protein
MSLANAIVITDVPWLVDPATGKVVGVRAAGSFQGSVIGAPDQPVAIYPGAQGALSSFAVQTITAAAQLALGTIYFADCTAGSIVCTMPAPVTAGNSGLVIVTRMDSTPNSAASVTFAVAASSGQVIADSNPKLSNGQSIMWAFNGTYWKRLN